MADINGAGNTTLGGLQATAAGLRLGWVATVKWPMQLDRVPLLHPTLTFQIDPEVSGLSQAQVQVATDAGFSSIVWSGTVLNVPESVDHTAQVGTTLTDGGSYYWRVRGGDGTSWGLWAAAGPFTVDTNVGDAIMYGHQNVGIEHLLDRDVTAVEYGHQSVGVELVLDRDVTAAEYSHLNVGIQLVLVGDAFEYGHEGDVNTNTPTPHLWFLEPESGRAGDGIVLYGWGFGDLQTTYDGVVEYQDPDLGWTPIGVVTWQTFPPTPDAYGPNRKLDVLHAEIDMQHTRIGIVIPPGIIPPGAPVRVRTNGP